LELAEVSVVVTLHLEEEHLAIRSRGCWHKLVIDDSNDLPTDLIQFLLNLLTVDFDQVHILLIALLLLFLLKAREASPRITTKADSILVPDAQKVALLNS
jgi:hypothetical protein